MAAIVRFEKLLAMANGDNFMTIYRLRRMRGLYIYLTGTKRYLKPGYRVPYFVPPCNTSPISQTIWLKKFITRAYGNKFMTHFKVLSDKTVLK